MGGFDGQRDGNDDDGMMGNGWQMPNGTATQAPAQNN